MIKFNYTNKYTYNTIFINSMGIQITPLYISEMSQSNKLINRVTSRCSVYIFFTSGNSY